MCQTPENGFTGKNKESTRKNVFQKNAQFTWYPPFCIFLQLFSSDFKETWFKYFKLIDTYLKKI